MNCDLGYHYNPIHSQTTCHTLPSKLQTTVLLFRKKDCEVVQPALLSSTFIPTLWKTWDQSPKLWLNRINTKSLMTPTQQVCEPSHTICQGAVTKGERDVSTFNPALLQKQLQKLVSAIHSESSYNSDNLTAHLEFNQDMEWRGSCFRNQELFEKSGDTGSFCCLPLTLTAEKREIWSSGNVWLQCTGSRHTHTSLLQAKHPLII